ncbi:MAG: relaxase domain-containing protein, partial [Actinobacteria bacterium]|nr:relaxase domain-containing protein [Actinomycetota bacterium]
MLSIGKLGRGQEDYYLSTVAKGVEDYYTGAGEAPGEWGGAGAARLGLTGQVTPEQLRSVLGGVDPVSGDVLGGQTRKDRVPGWDLTFSAPKSVSVLYALGGDQVSQAAIAAHREAVAAGIGYLETHATTSRRRVNGEIELVRGEGLVVAAFRHRTSRAGDPHLHTHCLAANAVERIDGGWGALYSPLVYRHARTAGFVYQAVLRAELTERLGVAWGPVHNGYAEIEGIDRRLLQRFSKRRAEIGEAMAARGETTTRASRTATLDTRQAKDYGVDPETLTERWASEAAELGAEVDVRGALGQPAPCVTPAHLETIVDELVGPTGLTCEQASFDRRDVVRGWCGALPAGAGVDLEALEELAEGFLEEDRVVAVLDSRARLAPRQVLRTAEGRVTTAVAVERRWSTAEMLSVERRLLERAEASRGVGAGQVAEAVVNQRLAASPSLSAEQAAMVRTICGSGDAVEVVVGRAGTGKTYALAAAASVWRAGGYRPIGLAIAARAAADLEATAGIPSTTLAQFLRDSQQAPDGLLSDRHVVVVDEAGMVDTRRLAALLSHVEAAGAKAVLVGDHHQLPAVEAGGAFSALVQRLGAVELAENRRQCEVWEREVLDQLRIGAGGKAGIVDVVARYDGRGRIHMGESPATVRGAMVADWYEAQQRGEAVAMLALRRADVAELNARARALLVTDGIVSAEGVTAAGRTFAPGDRVVCLENDRRLGVHNAMFGRIVSADASQVVMEAETTGARLVLPESYVAAGNLDHAYATTIHKAQGATYDRTLLLGDDRLYRQAGYTGLSRGRERNDLYLV